MHEKHTIKTAWTIRPSWWWTHDVRNI